MSASDPPPARLGPPPEPFPDYVVVVLEAVENGRTVEAHAEAADLDAVVVRIREAIAGGRPWEAITIFHAADYAKFQEGATRLQ